MPFTYYYYHHHHHLGFQLYQIQNKKQMCCPAMARILSNTLFYKRFFFLIKVYNVLGGLDNDGMHLILYAIKLFLTFMHVVEKNSMLN